MQPHSKTPSKQPVPNDEKQKLYNQIYNNYVESQLMVMRVPMHMFDKVWELHKFNTELLDNFKKDNGLA